MDLDNEGGIGAIPANRGDDKDPRILLTTSAKATRDTYTFAEELRGIFPGGEFFKRPAGKWVHDFFRFLESIREGGEASERAWDGFEGGLSTRADLLPRFTSEGTSLEESDDGLESEDTTL